MNQCLDSDLRKCQAENEQDENFLPEYVIDGVRYTVMAKPAEDDKDCLIEKAKKKELASMRLINGEHSRVCLDEKDIIALKLGKFDYHY